MADQLADEEQVVLRLADAEAVDVDGRVHDRRVAAPEALEALARDLGVGHVLVHAARRAAVEPAVAAQHEPQQRTEWPGDLGLRPPLLVPGVAERGMAVTDVRG